MAHPYLTRGAGSGTAAVDAAARRTGGSDSGRRLSRAETTTSTHDSTRTSIDVS